MKLKLLKNDESIIAHKSFTSNSQLFLKKNSKLAGITYLAKDNFWTEDLVTTACSDFLIDFTAGEDSTVIKLLAKEGALLLGKTIMDEFACGGTGLLANKKRMIYNPYSSQHITGGSSSGSAVAVAKGLATFALGSDTGGSVREPAAYCGVIGFKPSYGIISRYGLVPMSSSLDTVGILANSVVTAQKIFSIISQPDYHDLLTIANNQQKFKSISFSSAKKVVILEEVENYLSTDFAKLYQKTLDILRKNKYVIETIKMPQIIRENLQLTYLIICSTELVSHLNSCQGVTYGKKVASATDYQQKLSQIRGSFLGEVVKQRLLLGSFFLQNSHDLDQAYRLRQKVKKWIERIFREYDFLLFPSTNSEAPKAKNNNFVFASSQSHWNDNLMLLANLAGTPSLSLPIGFANGLPVSININSAYKQDHLSFQLASLLEKELNFNKSCTRKAILKV